MVATGNNLDGLIHDIYGEGEDKVILTIKNEDAKTINSNVLKLMSRDMFHS
jgi:hypothetical protein